MSALTESTFSGHRPTGAGDLSVETHGIAPIAEDQRYGTPRRLFTVWFAPQVNMTGVFTGALAIVLGLGFWLGMLAMVIGTVLGSLVVGYLSTWGPRTGAGQLPNSRMAFGGGVVLPAALPAQPAIKPKENQQEKIPNEEPYEDRNVQPPVNISTPSVARETGHQRSIVVKYGDTLEKLALRHLGSRYALNEIIDDNPQIMDINRIYPGQKVYLSRSGQTTAGAGSTPRDASQPSPSFAADTSRIDDSKLPGFRDRRKN